MGSISTALKLTIAASVYITLNLSLKQHRLSEMIYPKNKRVKDF